MYDDFGWSICEMIKDVNAMGVLQRVPRIQ